MSGIYVHIPYCRSRCLYCDFYSCVTRNVLWSGYVRSVVNELRRRLDTEDCGLECGDIDTIYIGGGTPSLMPADDMTALIREIRSVAQRDPAELTIEVNPEDVTPEMVDAWSDAGVNRVSMGVQSLVDSELRAVGRRHDAASAVRAFESLTRRFDNISLDMIFGLPGQTAESLRATLDGFMDMRPQHISAYSLMYEERSALTRLRDAGRVSEVDDMDAVEMFRTLSSILKDNGYIQYEISNYALPGYESRHNSSYWRGVPYLGLGPGAHSYDGRSTRRYNNPDVKLYMDVWNGRDLMTPDVTRLVTEEVLSEAELAEEMIMTRLRTAEGLDLREFGNRFGMSRAMELVNMARKWVCSGMLEANDRRIRLTSDGIMISDEIISDLF